MVKNTYFISYNFNIYQNNKLEETKFGSNIFKFRGDDVDIYFIKRLINQYEYENNKKESESYCIKNISILSINKM